MICISDSTKLPVGRPVNPSLLMYCIGLKLNLINELDNSLKLINQTSASLKISSIRNLYA